MSTKQKNILTFIGGIVVGVILTFGFGYAKSYFGGNGIVWYEEPGEVIPCKTFRVIQVYSDGSAMAFGDGGIVVVFPGDEESTHYDGEEIKISSGECIRQVGTYRYMANNGMRKTVPIVAFFDK